MSGQIEPWPRPMSATPSATSPSSSPTPCAVADGAADRYLGTETRDGRPWGVIRVSFGDEDSYDAFIDPATGELDGCILENRKGRFWNSFYDWRVVDGVRVPFLLAIRN